MVWCHGCCSDVDTEANEADGFTCCTQCGAVLDDVVFSRDPTFIKVGGHSQVKLDDLKGYHALAVFHIKNFPFPSRPKGTSFPQVG